MKIKINENKVNKIKLNVNKEDELKRLAREYENRYKDYIIVKPEIPKVDSKGKSINSKNKPSYVKIIRKESTELPTIMRSRNNTAGQAEVYKLSEGWVSNPKMWQDYVYDGSLGLDYEYVDDSYIKEIINKYKMFSL